MADLEKYFNLYHLMYKGLLEIEKKNLNKSLEKNKSNANGPEMWEKMINLTQNMRYVN